MSLQLPTILSPPTRCTPAFALTVSPQVRPRSCRRPSPGRLPSRASLILRMLANAPGRIEFIIFVDYGLVVCFRLPSTPPLDDAVAFSFGQPVFLSDEDFHPAVGAHFQAHGGTASVPSLPYSNPLCLYLHGRASRPIAKDSKRGSPGGSPYRRLPHGHASSTVFKTVPESPLPRLIPR